MLMKYKLTINNIMYQLVLLLAFFINFSTAAASIAVGIGFLTIIYQIIKCKQFPTIDKEFIIIFAIYFVMQIIIALCSLDVLVSLREVIGEMHRCLPFFFAIMYIKEQYQLRNVLIVILISNIINDFTGIYQWFFLNIPRPYAFNHTATFFGSFLLMQIPIHIFIAMLPIMPKWSRILAVFACVVSLFSLTISLTRGAWLAFIIVSIAFMLIDKIHRKMTLRLLSIILICFVAASVFFPLIWRSVKTITDPYYSSNTERVLMWKSSINIFKDYPVHGIGQKMFQRVYNDEYILPNAIDKPGKDGQTGHSHPHSNIFKVLSEGGLIGIFAFTFLYGYFFHRFYIVYWREKNIMSLSAGLTAFLILLGLQIEGLTDTNMNQVPIMREYWLLTGILLSPSILTTYKAGEENEKRS